MEFYKKRILIVSPQKWEGLKVSKHNYALELLKRENEVYFLQPPDNNLIHPFFIEKKEKNLFIVSHKFRFPYNLRFHWRRLYNFFVNQHVNGLSRQLGAMDVLWCFEVNLYPNLKRFNANLSIYHPVDISFSQNFIEAASSADYIFSVSPQIIDRLKGVNVPSYFINHGVKDEFITNDTYKIKDRINACYMGNLMMQGVDRESILTVVKENKDIFFHFIGPYEESEFINRLKQTKNCKLYGLKNQKEIIDLFSIMDIFMICYDPEIELNKGSNSHKILEYLSSGKVIVANYISTYSDKKDLVEMLNNSDNTSYPTLFKTVCANLLYYNSPEKMLLRRNYAKTNTYSNQIMKIQNIINAEKEA